MRSRMVVLPEGFNVELVVDIPVISVLCYRKIRHSDAIYID